MIGRIGSLAYLFVLAGDFTNAFDAVDQAVEQVVPLAPDRHRAHALMFLGRIEETRAIYLGHRGAKNVVGEKSWETVVMEDFAELRAAKLMHPLMGDREAVRCTGVNAPWPDWDRRPLVRADRSAPLHRGECHIACAHAREGEGASSAAIADFGNF
jgi:hypothetical protein